MTPEKYQERIDSCKTREELLTLKENTLKKNREDLAAIADKYLLDRFPTQKRFTPSTGKSKTHIPYEQAKDNYRSHPTLSQDQVEFLAKHKIPERYLFNARGMRAAVCKERMSGTDYVIAYGVTPCEKSGHTLRSSAGHCVQCKPSVIAYTLRHRASGEVYVAESNTEPRIVKVGSAKSSVERISGLNSEQYAGCHDWNLKYYYGVTNMGLVESEVHAALSQLAITDRYYFKDGQKTECREIFSCSVDAAIEVLKETIKKHS
jgi:hypothetical protein